MVVRELVALMGIKTDKKGFQDAENGMGKMVKLAKAAAVAFASLQVVRWIKGAITDVAELGDSFDKLSKRTGIATKTLQQLDHAASLSGASLGDVETALRRLQASQVDAAAGLKTYTREWDRLGIDIKDSEGNFKDTTELLVEMADGMKNLESDAERTAVATKLLGRSGTALIPMFKEGSQALRDMMNELDDYGAIIEEDMIKQSADFVDNQRRVEMSILSIKNAIAKEALPWINKVTKGMLNWWKTNGKWVRQGISSVFRKLAPIIARIASVIGKVVVAGARLIRWTSKFIKSLDPTKKKILALGVALGVIIKLLRAGAWGKFLFIAGLIFLVLDDLFAFLEGKPSLIGKLNDKLKELFDLDLREAIEGIKLFFDNLTQEGVSASEVWGGLWDEMVLILKDRLGLAGEWWAGFWEWFTQPVSDMYDFLVSVFEKIFFVLLFPFQQALKFITDVWEVGILGALDRLRIQILDWVDTILDKISAPFKAIGKWIAGFGTKAISVEAENPTVKGLQTAATGGARVAVGSMAPQVKARPQAGGAPSITQKTNITVDVKAAPGMSEEALMSAARRHMKKFSDEQNRAALQALTPTVSAIPGA